MEGFEYKPQFRVLICREHQTAIAPTSLPNHLYRAHGLRHKVRARLLSEFRATYDLALPGEVPLPPPFTPPIAGLKLEAAYLCTLDNCDLSSGHLSLHLSKVQLHRGRRHGVHHQGAQAGIRRVHAQTFFRERRFLRYFVVGDGGGVLGNSPMAGGTPDEQVRLPHAPTLAAESFEASQQTWAKSFDGLAQPDRATQETPWLKRTGFGDHLKGYSKASLIKATASPAQGSIRRGRESGSDSGDEASGPSTLYGTGAAPRHCPELSLVGAACYRLLRKAHSAAGQSGTGARLSTRHALVLNSLESGRTATKPFRQVQDLSTLRRYSANWVRFLAYVWRIAFGELAEELGPLLELTTDQRNTLGSVKITVGLESDAPESDPVTGWLTNLEFAVLCLSLQFIQHPIQEGPYESALLSYVAARALKRDGSWRAPSDMTSFLASLTYVIQLLLFADTRHNADESEATPFGELLTQQCRRWLVNDRLTPSAEILSWRLYARQVASATLPTAYTSWSEDGQTVTYRNAVMTMTEWRRLIHEQIHRAGVILHEQLLFNQEGRPHPRAQSLLDVETETRPGYNFSQDPRNGLSLHGRWVLDLLLREPELPKSPIEMRDGTVVWRASHVAGYLDAVTAFLEHLLLAMHLTGGLPGRAPEIISLRHCNDEQPRNIMIHDGQVMFITGYHKMQYAAGSRLVCRFLPAELGDILVTYLCMVLPFVRHVELLHGHTTSRSALFARGQTPWKAERLTAVMRRESGAILGMELVVSSYRHLAIAMDRRHLRGVGVQSQGIREDGEGAGESREDHVNDLQASHSTFTSDVNYANSVRTGRMFNDPKLHQFRQTSKSWHELAHQASRLPRGTSKRPRTESLQASVQDPSPPNNPGWLATLPQRPSGRRPWTDNEIDQGMRKIHGTDAMPRSEGQWNALVRLGEGLPQIIVVLPTGGGKSLLFQLPSVMPGAGVTAVILPLVALRQDLTAQCRKLGLSYTLWDATLEVDSACAPLLLVGVEDACREAFQGLLRRLSLEGRLDRIFLDEAQMVLTDSHYREALVQVRQTRRMPVPFVALTATLPPSMETALSTALFMDRPLILRRSVDRPNLVYRVVEKDAVAKGMSLLEAAVALLRRPELRATHANDRALIYAGTKSEVEALATLLACPAYHAGVSNREAIFTDWVAGRTRVIVGTNAIGAGVDYAGVRLVVHVGTPWSAVAYGQESGRAGRDGRRAHCIVLVDRAPVGLDGAGQPSDPDRVAMRRMLRSDIRCRRQVLTAYLDGGDGVACSEVSFRCNACTTVAVASVIEPGVSRPNLPSTQAPPLDDNAVGDCLAREAHRADEEGKAWHRQRLRTWGRDACLACFIRPGNLSWRHRPCTASEREATLFQEAQALLDFPPHIGCYHCANPEWLCPSDGDLDECLWGRIALWLCFLCHQSRAHPMMKDICNSTLPSPARRQSPTLLFTWLQGTGTLYGKPCFNVSILVEGILRALPE